MGLLQSLSHALGLGKGLDIEEYMDTIELENVDMMHEAADFYVKPVALESEADAKVIAEELKNRNLILLNITPMKKNEAKLKMIVNELKKFVTKLDGDIARIDEDKILLTPARVKIVKSKRSK